MNKSENYLFDRFCLSVRAGADGPPEIRLYSNGRLQKLTQQEAKMLQILIERRGDFVETNLLAKEVCGGEDRADEGVIHTATTGLRRIFNDPPEVSEFIENKRKRGYRFAKPVRMASDEELDAEMSARADEKPPTRDGGGDTAAAQPEVSDDLKDQVIGFRALWLSAGALLRWVIVVGVFATVAVSVVVIVRWLAGGAADAQRSQDASLAFVSIPQLFMLLFALWHVLPGPRRLREDFREAAGYDNPQEADDARYIAENALGRYTFWWRGILATWFLLYLCLVFVAPGNAEQNQVVGILTTLFNNLSTAMFVLCYNVLNRPVEIKAGKRDVSDTPWLWRCIVLVLAFLLAEILVARFFGSEKAELLYALSLFSGIAGAIGMALYVGRLQSKFLGPSPGLVIALYSYIAIQPLFIFLVSVPKDKQVFAEPTVSIIAVVLVNIALILKCILYLYVALLFKSGHLLFYLVKVRRTYLNVDRERREFRKLLKWES